MAEPDNHALRLLREIRGDIQKLDRKVDTVDKKLDSSHGQLQQGVDAILQTLAGEIADRAYAAGGIERRLSDIEKRLSALEEAR